MFNFLHRNIKSVSGSLVVSVAVAVPLASWGTTAATRVPRLRIGERPREWTRGQHRIKKVPRTNSALEEGKL